VITVLVLSELPRALKDTVGLQALWFARTTEAGLGLLAAISAHLGELSHT